MPFLELEHVSKRYARGGPSRVGLDDVSLQLVEGEMVAVWGARRSGRSTLLRVAAGIELPDTGVVRYRERDVRDCEPAGEIAYCRRTFSPSEGASVLEHLLSAQEVFGVSTAAATASARRALARTGADALAGVGPHELDTAEIIRVAIARTLDHTPTVARD